MSTYQTVIGLEIHAELVTESKIFCGCTTEFGGTPNSHCCPVCLGLPGALPVLNERAVEYTIRAGLALDCQIATHSIFDRKNYFYPDLPKAYQISQFEYPICAQGAVEYELDDTSYLVGITRVHLEEEAGKSVHSGDTILGSEFSLMDYNRSGIPLIEIVSEPDLRSPAEARAFLEQLKSMLEYTKVSDCKMQEGSLRCDANVSLRPLGTKALGTKVEIKNLNSFKAVERALCYEVKRQTEVYNQGGTIMQETRAWDDTRGVTVAMRSKEESHDYRYFPEPDLVPLQIDATWVDAIKVGLPELPLAKKRRLIREYQIPAADAWQITQNSDMAAFFECVVASFADAKTVSNWLLGDFARLLNSSDLDFTETRITPEHFAGLLALIKKGTISGKQGKDVLACMFISGQDPIQIIKEKGLEQLSDSDLLEKLVQEIVAKNPTEVKRFQAGEDKLLGFFVGQVMKETRGRGNPGLINELLRAQLGKQ